MTITISAEDPRSIKAIQIAAGAAQWLKCKIADGTKAYGVPSTSVSGRYYLVTATSCDCPDAQLHAGRPCKHQLGVRLHCTLAKAQATMPKRRATMAGPSVATLAARYDDIFKHFED